MAVCQGLSPAHLEVSSLLSRLWMEQSELAGPLMLFLLEPATEGRANVALLQLMGGANKLK